MRYILTILAFILLLDQVAAKCIRYGCDKPYLGYKISLTVMDSIYEISGSHWSGGCIVYSALFSYGRFEVIGEKALLIDAITNMETEADVLEDGSIVIRRSFPALNGMMLKKVSEYSSCNTEDLNDYQEAISNLKTRYDSLLNTTSFQKRTDTVRSLSYRRPYFGYRTDTSAVAYFLDLQSNGYFVVRVNEDTLSKGIYTVYGNVIVFDDKHLKIKYFALAKGTNNLEVIGFPACYHQASFEKD